MRQSSPLRSEHEQPALRAAGSTCCYDQKKRSTNLIIYNQIGKCPFRGLAACAAKFSAALRTRTAPRSARRCWSTDCAPAKAQGFRSFAPSGGLPLRGKVLRCAPNTNSPRCARPARPAATTKKKQEDFRLPVSFWCTFRDSNPGPTD